VEYDPEIMLKVHHTYRSLHNAQKLKLDSNVSNTKYSIINGIGNIYKIEENRMLF